MASRGEGKENDEYDSGWERRLVPVFRMRSIDDGIEVCVIESVILIHFNGRSNLMGESTGMDRARMESELCQ